MTRTPANRVLLPDRLRALWDRVDQGLLDRAACWDQQQRLLAEHAETWRRALVLEADDELEPTLMQELAAYYGTTPERAQAQAHGTRDQIAETWRENVNPDDPQSVNTFYDACNVELYIHALMGWHTLRDDRSPLAYVNALQFASHHGCRQCLDFGAGVGSGSLLFAAHGLETTAADISTPMLAFTQWRFARRNLSGAMLDLKQHSLPARSFDFVAALDVFEHLPAPLETVDELAAAIRPGGFLFGRFAVEDDDEHPLHIVHDFQPLFEHMRARGFVQVWQDDWLWGHQAFQLR